MNSYNSTYLTDRLIAQCLKAGKQEWARTADGLWDATLKPFCILDSHNSYFQAVQKWCINFWRNWFLSTYNALSWARSILSPIYSLPSLQVSALEANCVLNLPCLSLASTIPDASYSNACKWVHELVSTALMLKREGKKKKATKKPTNYIQIPLTCFAHSFWASLYFGLT